MTVLSVLLVILAAYGVYRQCVTVSRAEAARRAAELAQDAARLRSYRLNKDTKWSE